MAYNLRSKQEIQVQLSFLLEYLGYSTQSIL